MRIYGSVKDKNGNPISGASIEVKEESFETIYQCESDVLGAYALDLPAGHYPFLIAVKDYASQNLEYWCQNINLTQDLQLDLRFDSLEIYGLHAFRVKGAYPSLMIYFRPMSLERYKRGEEDICPEIKEIHESVDGVPVSVLRQNKVPEYVGENDMTAFLIQVDLPAQTTAWKRLDVEIWDEAGAFGMATLFA